MDVSGGTDGGARKKDHGGSVHRAGEGSTAEKEEERREDRGRPEESEEEEGGMVKALRRPEYSGSCGQNTRRERKDTSFHIETRRTKTEKHGSHQSDRDPKTRV